MDALAEKFYAYLVGGMRPGLHTEADLPKLRRLAEKHAEARRLYRDCGEHGYSHEVPSREYGTLIEARPEALRLLQLHGQITKLSHKLRLTPKARFEYYEALRLLD